MTRAEPLPPELCHRSFSTAEALSLGVSPSRLRARDLSRPTRGVRTSSPVVTTPAEEETHSERLTRMHRELIQRAADVAPALTPDQFYSHDTGLALIGSPLPFSRAVSHELHVAARHPSPKPRREGVRGHRLAARESAHWRVRGLPIEHPARLWRQAAASWDLDDVIAAGDYLVHPRRSLVSVEDLWRELAEGGEVRGKKLQRALTEIRVGAETAEETRLRLAIVRAGLPEPMLNMDLHAPDGRHIARLDLAYPRLRVAVEHDGRSHAGEEQFARDADRWDDIRSESWTHLRILSHHLHPNPQVAVEKVAKALIDAGWRPGRPF